MKFIVDAQLPYGLALYLRRKGQDAIHTDDRTGNHPKQN
jgi:predicted nuclease of predicted toxin-antitoxin system